MTVALMGLKVKVRVRVRVLARSVVGMTSIVSQGQFLVGACCQWLWLIQCNTLCFVDDSKACFRIINVAYDAGDACKV